MVLVDPAARGRGVATTLLQCALRLVGSNAAARLDATPSGEPIYRALGFVSEFRLARWYLDANPSHIARPAGARPLEARDRTAVREMDVRIFGASRSTLLERLADEAPEYTRVLFAHGVLRGYLLRAARLQEGTARATRRRQRRHGDRASPVVPCGTPRSSVLHRRARRPRGLGAHALDAGVRNRAAVRAHASRRHDGGRRSISYLCHHRSGVRLRTGLTTSSQPRMRFLRISDQAAP